MSSASAADRVHCLAKSSRPGPISEKQFFQFSWLAMLSMTFSRSLFPRRRQPMNLSMPSNFFSFIALLAVAGAHAGNVDLEEAVGSLIAAEKAYAKLAAGKGFREASISVFADDAVIFVPNAVNGKKFWREAKKDPVISWRPIFASISRSGELGYTTGPWESRKSEKPDAFGHFVTIWQKNKRGVWKVTLDVGLDHPRPQKTETEIRTYASSSVIPHSESANADLEKAQRSFAESLKEDEGDAIIANASSPPLAKKLPRKCLPKRMRKRRVRHQVPASVTPLISPTNTANSRVSAITSHGVASTFAFGDSSRMAPGE